MDAKTIRLGRIVRFCIVGGFAVGIQWAVLYGLTEFIGVFYLLSAATAFIVSTGASFLLQKLWAFQNKEVEGAGRQLVFYFVMKGIFLALDVVLLDILVEVLHVWYMWAQMLLTVVFSIISYFLSERIFVSSK